MGGGEQHGTDAADGSEHQPGEEGATPVPSEKPPGRWAEPTAMPRRGRTRPPRSPPRRGGSGVAEQLGQAVELPLGGDDANTVAELEHEVVVGHHVESLRRTARREHAEAGGELELAERAPGQRRRGDGEALDVEGPVPEREVAVRPSTDLAGERRDESLGADDGHEIAGLGDDVGGGEGDAPASVVVPEGNPCGGPAELPERGKPEALDAYRPHDEGGRRALDRARCRARPVAPQRGARPPARR